MPPSRSTKRTSGAQSTLSFSNKNKVTKPTPISKQKDLFPTSSAKAQDSISSKASDSEVPLEKKDDIVPKAAQKEVVKQRTPKEIEAAKVGDTQVKRYWRQVESERIAKRVHQEDLSLEEKILRLFDMSSQYGPAIGINRTKRWNRAFRLGLNPPIEVLAVLLKEEDKGDTKFERAHVDELMSNKLVVGGEA